MNHEQLKKLIIDRFGTLKNFCELSGQSNSVIKSFVNRKLKKTITQDEQNRIDNIAALARNTPNNNLGVLTQEDRIAIKQAIQVLYDTVSGFCAANPEYEYNYLTNLRRKNRKGEKEIKLMELLQNQLIKKQNEQTI